MINYFIMKKYYYYPMHYYYFEDLSLNFLFTDPKIHHLI